MIHLHYKILTHTVRFTSVLLVEFDSESLKQTNRQKVLCNLTPDFLMLHKCGLSAAIRMHKPLPNGSKLIQSLLLHI